MIGASKILTVSYGTFSCTLEGFDEPFNTMKAIAEYFRDLAAEDRYFGAEPPTPDAAMLHKIAEREIHRRVEAKIQENGVILRTGEALEAPGGATMPVAVAVAPTVSTLIDVDDQPLLTDAPLAAESVAAKLSRLRASAASTVLTADLSASLDGYAEDQHADDMFIAPREDELAPQTLSDDRFAASLTIEDAVSIEEIDQTSSVVELAIEDGVETDGIDENAASPVEVIPSDENAERLIANLAETTQLDYQDDAFDDLIESIDQDALDDLARLDGEIDGYDDVEMLDDAAHHSAPVDEKEHADATMPTHQIVQHTSADDDALLASLGNLIDDDDQSDLALLDDDLEDDFESDDDIAADTATLSAPSLDLPPQAFDDLSSTSAPADGQAAAPNEGAEEFAEPELIQRARARVIKIRRSDATAFVPQPAPEQPTSLLSDEAEAALQAELAALEAEAMPAETFALPSAQIALDAEFETELAEISIPENVQPAPTLVRPNRPVRSLQVTRVVAEQIAVSEISDTDVAYSIVKETYLEQSVVEPSPDLEGVADDAKAVADDLEFLSDEVDAFGDHAEPVIDDIKPAAYVEAAAPAGHDIEGDVADEAIGRLMAQTNSALDGAEVKRRQSAIAHLKAAVASTEAERMVVPNQPKGDQTESYRSDLESVVRPMRPGSGVAGADRPQPLVLVSAQRIDRLPRSENVVRSENIPRIVSPVRPRRVVVAATAAGQQDSLFGANEDDLDEGEGLDDAAINMFAETESFADFADRLGASDLPDVLEAAAVYCASVLGRPEFSRPLVLRQVATLPETADLSREDGLRVFGTLMRQGRITKTRRGQFAVTDRSPILAEALRSAS